MGAGLLAMNCPASVSVIVQFFIYHYVLIHSLDERKRPENLTSDTSNATEQSRYSVTDYFEKYPPSAPKTDKKTSVGPFSNNGNNPISGTVKFDKPVHEGREPFAENGREANTGERLTSNTGTKAERFSEGESEKSMTKQDQLYKGTELDTSLSTIRDSDDVISLMSSALTASSVASIDDREFRDGLASLDAHIARIQASLKQVALKWMNVIMVLTSSRKSGKWYVLGLCEVWRKSG